MKLYLVVGWREGAGEKYHSQAATLYKDKLHALATHALRLHGTKVTFLVTFEVVSGGGLEGGGGGGVDHCRAATLYKDKIHALTTHALRLHGTKVTFLLTYEVVSGGGLEGGGGEVWFTAELPHCTRTSYMPWPHMP